MMAKPFFPGPELRQALAELLGLENLSNVRTITIKLNGGEAVTVDVDMFIWDHARLTSVVQQLQIDTDRVTNVSVGITPAMAAALERDDRDLIP